MPVETLTRTYRPKEINPEPASQGEALRGSLVREIEYFRQNWQREGLPYNWSDLPGTGFQMRGQLNLLFSELNNADNPDKRREKTTLWLTQTEEDLKGFILEYLAEGLVFPIYYEIKKEEGRLTASLYGDKDVEDLVSPQERKGVVKESVRKIKTFLLNDITPDGAVAVMTSPAGWSGLRDEEGSPITYPDSQTYIFQKNGTKIVGFTVRTDFSLNEHRELLRRLNSKDLLSQNATVCDYVANVTGLYPANGEDAIKKVVDIMRDVRSSPVAYKNKLWQEVYRNLDRREELWRFDEHTKAMVEELKQFVLTQNWSKKDLQEALAVTVLRIAKFLRGEKYKQADKIEFHYHGQWDKEFSPRGVLYGEVLTEVQEIPGCAGGGSKKSELVNSLTPRFGETEWFTCPKCGYKADGPVGDECPECHLTKEEYAKSGQLTC